LKFFRQNNYTEKAKILYFLNLVYFLSLVGLWQNHVIYLPLTGLMSHYTTPFTKRVVNKYGSVCPCYQSFFYGTLHMRARIDEVHNYKEKMFTFQTWKKYSNSNSNSNIYWIKHINVVKYMTYIIITMLRNPIHSQKSSIYRCNTTKEFSIAFYVK
jgi:hypothetical protein